MMSWWNFKLITEQRDDQNLIYNQYFLLGISGVDHLRLSALHTTSSYKVTPQLSYYGIKTRVELNGSCLKQDSVTFNHRKIVNIYIVYEKNKSINISDYSTLENCLFGAVSLTKNADILSTNILDMELDSTEKDFIQLAMKSVEMW